MAFDKETAAIEFVQERAKKYAQSIEYRRFDGAIVVRIPVSRVSDTASSTSTSKRQLTHLVNDVNKRFGRELLAIFVLDEVHESMEMALSSLLRQRFPKGVRSILVSVPSTDNVTVIIEPYNNKPPADGMVSKANELVERFFELQDMHLKTIEWVGATVERPTLSILLRMVKTLAPVDISDIVNVLYSQDYWYIDEKQLRHQLDALRKKGFVVRQRSGKYVPTELALHAVPHGATRSSSDVDRALELGRRKW